MSKNNLNRMVPVSQKTILLYLPTASVSLLLCPNLMTVMTVQSNLMTVQR